jgi:hypothetical protein
MKSTGFSNALAELRGLGGGLNTAWWRVLASVGLELAARAAGSKFARAISMCVDLEEYEGHRCIGIEFLKGGVGDVGVDDSYVINAIESEGCLQY